MKNRISLFLVVAIIAIVNASFVHAKNGHGADKRYFMGYSDHNFPGGYYDHHGKKKKDDGVTLGPRPGFLVDGMAQSPLKKRLKSCENGPFYKTDFSIGHRGAPMQFPEHTKESYVAAARQGAGILECDVTFTKDGHLVCRHAECDLHTTTNILQTDLADTCAVPFSPAEFDSEGNRTKAASARCCASALTRREFLSLEGKMDAADANATSVEEYMYGAGSTAEWRTDLYNSRGTLLTHRQSIRLFQKLGAGFTPELKSGAPESLVKVFNPGGDPSVEADVRRAQRRYARKMIMDYRRLGIHPKRVWAQSFNPEDVKYWINRFPKFGEQAVYLDSRYMGEIDPVNGDVDELTENLMGIAADGVQIIAPPMYFLLSVTDYGKIVPSPYAIAAKRAGLDVIAWTFERSDLRMGSRSNPDDPNSTTFYYAFDTNPNAQAIETDSDMYKALDVLAKDVGIIGIFSDWPATVTYYANCMGLK